MKRHVLAVTILAIVSTALVQGQPYPAQERGLSADGGYQVNGVDEINLFNGQLVAGVPLAPGHPVGPSLSLGLAVTYNSNGWSYEDRACNGAPYVLPVPEPRANAGFGWTLELGRIQSPGESESGRWTYLSPDGGAHGQYPELHPGYPSPPQGNTWFSNDSTYLRMKRFPTGSTQCKSAVPAGLTSECLLLEMPDGIVHEFRSFAASGGSDYRVTQLRDRFSNSIDLAYPGGGAEWRLTDSHGRIQRIFFDGPASGPQKVTRVELTSFGGGTATYTFTYAQQTLDRLGYGDPPACAEGSQVTVDVLRRIEQPDGSFYEMTYYSLADGVEVLPGGLKSLRLPTRGELRYTYTPIGFLSQDPAESLADWIRIAYGVATREVYELAGQATPLGTWTYVYGRSGPQVPAAGGNTVSCHHTTTVRDPHGNETVNYFASSDSRHLWSYGLPMTRCGSGAYDANPPFLSQEIYDGTAATGTLLRSIYVDYGGDGPDGGEQQEKNLRLRYRKVIYHDDGDHQREVTLSSFDGLGHFRHAAVRADFSANDDRDLTIDFNPSRGDLVIDPDTGSTTGTTFVMPSKSAPWVLDTFTEQRAEEDGEAAITEFCFDESTGFLERARTLAGTSRASNDLLTVMEQETGSTGRVGKEVFYGGDAQGSMDATYGDLCQMTLPATAQYRLDHTYESGALKASAWIDTCDGTEVLRVADFDIDASTGLPAVSRDASGVATSLVFDDLGRIESIRPAEGVWVNYDFETSTPADPNAFSRVTVTECPNGQTSCAGPLSWQRQVFDGLGRLMSKLRHVPESGGVQVERRNFDYDSMGWLTSVTSWHLNGAPSPPATVYDMYDRFGRPGRITPPGSPAVKITYEGDRTRTREVSVMLAGGTRESAFTTETYDDHGRLASVCEDRGTAWAGSCAGGRQTDYEFDVAGRLTQVCMEPSANGCGQERDFVFDQRGLLTAERHPELGPSGNGFTFYTYDALGNVLSKDLAGSTKFDLFFAYDPAARLIRVEEPDPFSFGSSRLLKEFYYARSNQGTDRRKGKLYQARRHNWVQPVGPLAAPTPDLHAVVTETYRYEGLGGAVSDRQTRFTFNALTFAFQTSFDFDAQGNLSALDYPECLHPGCAGAAPARQVTYGYTRGFLTSVPGFASAFTYQAGGLPHQVKHTNGVTWTLDIDAADGIARPHQISTTAGWNTGTYAYDGVGNVQRIGTQTYRYDRLNRMVEGKVLTSGQLHTQTATFDAYGNVTQLVNDGNSTSVPVDAATNRITLSGSSYDAGGNLTRLAVGGEVFAFEYDGLGAMKHLQSNTDLARIFIYTADDERLAIFDCVNNSCETQGSAETWTIRGLDGRVLRKYRHPWNQGWEWERDYVYRGGGLLLAAAEPDGQGGENTFHFHLDHLGTPRQITNQNGTQVAFHAYYPFGREITGLGQDELAMKFTGHERDINGTGARGDLDYMHARFCSPFLGRFLSFDPAGGNPRVPQSWNRYAYALGNPLKFVDPYGLTPQARFYDSITVRAYPSQDLGGFLDFLGFGAWFRSGFSDGISIDLGFLSRLFNVETARHFYQQNINKYAGDNDFLAALNFIILDQFVPDSQAELGIELAMAVIPGPLDNAAFAGVKVAKPWTTTAAREAGRAGELAADIVKNTKWIESVSRAKNYRIPDFLDRANRLIGEVKNAAKLSFSSQLRDSLSFAQKHGFRFELIVRQGTRLSGPLQRAVDAGEIILRRTLP